MAYGVIWRVCERSITAVRQYVRISGFCITFFSDNNCGFFGLGGRSDGIAASSPLTGSLVPLPATLLLFGSGLVCLIRIAKRKVRV